MSGNVAPRRENNSDHSAVERLQRVAFDDPDEHGFRSPSLRIPAPAFQVALLSAYEPWMTGTLVYSEIFWDLDCVGLRDNHD